MNITVQEISPAIYENFFSEIYNAILIFTSIKMLTHIFKLSQTFPNKIKFLRLSFKYKFILLYINYYFNLHILNMHKKLHFLLAM